MSANRAREPRQPVELGARLKSERGWSDVVIRNVSRRGLMGVCPSPPARGEYVEVRRGTYTIVARVAWANDNGFGARSQDAIELSELLAKARQVANVERRNTPRLVEPARVPSLAERTAAAERRGRAFDFVSVCLAGAALSAAIGSVAHEALAAPMAQVSRALGGADER